MLFPRKSSHIRTGRQGENLAADFLVSHGYTILERNYRNRIGELDIVARDGDTIVFVEVKTRKTHRYGTGFDAVDLRKQKRLAAIALHYLQSHKLLDAPSRFDVVAITLHAGRERQIELLRDAIECSQP